MESGGRLVNCFVEQLGEGKEGRVKRIRVPGLTEKYTSAGTGNAVMMSVPAAAGSGQQDRVYVAYLGELYRTNGLGGALVLHASGASYTPFEMARNQKYPEPDKLIISGDTNLVGTITYAGGLGFYGVGNLPNLPPITVCNVNGYFFIGYPDGRIFASDQNDVNQDPLSFTNTYAKPDSLLRCIAYNGRLYAFGKHSIEVWTDVGGEPFPFQRAAVIPFGLIDRRAVAGYDDAFSAGLLWVANDFTVRMLDGYNAVKVSPPDLDRLLTVEDSVANHTWLAGCYVVDGHSCWYITGDDFTWVLDLNTMKWHERASHLDTRWRAWPTVQHYAGYWLAGDIDGGNLYQIDPTNHTEDGDPLRARLESAAVSAFPARTRVLRADFEMETGVGITGGEVPIETDPTIAISWSDDGGVTWGNPLTRALGQQAQYRDISIYNVGRTTRYGRRWRLDVSDPVYVNFVGGHQSAEPRR
jgi:hypothetical protein